MMSSSAVSLSQWLRNVPKRSFYMSGQGLFETPIEIVLAFLSSCFLDNSLERNKKAPALFQRTQTLPRYLQAGL